MLVDRMSCERSEESQEEPSTSRQATRTVREFGTSTVVIFLSTATEVSCKIFGVHP